MIDWFESLFNFSSITGTEITILFILWMFIAGMIISCLVIFYNDKVIGSFVRSLIRAGAISEETAKTLSEIGQSHNSSAINSIRKSRYMRMTVAVINKDQNEDSKTGSHVFIDENTKFYIREKYIDHANRQFSGKGSSFWVLVLCVLGLLAAGVVITYIYFL